MDILPRVKWSDIVKPIKDEFRNDVNRAVQMIKNKTPVKTGALQRGIHSGLIKEDKANINLNADILSEMGYFSYVDTGTRYITPRNFSEDGVRYLESKGYDVTYIIKGMR